MADQVNRDMVSRIRVFVLYPGNKILRFSDRERRAGIRDEAGIMVYELGFDMSGRYDPVFHE
jgi:hypothetical protein